MKKIYEYPEWKICFFEEADVITFSTNDVKTEEEVPGNDIGWDW